MPQTFTDVQDAPGGQRRITLLHLLDADPLDTWRTTFALDGELAAAGGVGTVAFCGPFIPTVVGTDRYALDGPAQG